MTNINHFNISTEFEISVFELSKFNCIIKWNFGKITMYYKQSYPFTHIPKSKDQNVSSNISSSKEKVNSLSYEEECFASNQFQKQWSGLFPDRSRQVHTHYMLNCFLSLHCRFSTVELYLYILIYTTEYTKQMYNIEAGWPSCWSGCSRSSLRRRLLLMAITRKLLDTTTCVSGSEGLKVTEIHSRGFQHQLSFLIMMQSNILKCNCCGFFFQWYFHYLDTFSLVLKKIYSIHYSLHF